VFVLLNTTDQPLTGTIQFYDEGAGTAAAPIPVAIDNESKSSSYQYTIPPRSSKKLETSGQDTAVSVGSVRVTAASGSSAPVGVKFFSSTNSAVRVSEASVWATTAPTRSRMYSEATPGVAIPNATANTAVVTFSLTDLDGVTAGTSETRILPPN